ncbi:MAG: lamin tail domain-containing protein [Anaerolineae bacterium]|nr:lamin tail domain-containing protein [Anaerolineae bacterium]
MDKFRRFLPFILLNILISALTTLIVLWVWDATHNPSAGMADDPQALLQTLQATQVEQPTQQPTLPPLDRKVIKIENVFAAGDLENEVVVLKRSGSGILDLTGWRLVDESNRTFVFPTLSLNTDGAVQVFSKAGSNTVIALYWHQTRPVWEPGETVLLLDPDGNPRDSYTIP